MSAEWEVPRCAHGHIILGCPHDDCVTGAIHWYSAFALRRILSPNLLGFLNVPTLGGHAPYQESA